MHCYVLSRALCVLSTMNITLQSSQYYELLNADLEFQCQCS